MNENSENINPIVGWQYQRTPAFAASRPLGAGTQGHPGAGSEPGKAAANGEVRPSSLDPWTFVELILRRWYWLILSGVLLAAAGVILGKTFFHPSYQATVKFLRLDAQNGTEFYKPRPFSEQTYSALLRAPALLERVAAQAQPPLSMTAMNDTVTVTPLRDSEIVMAVLTAPSPEAAVHLANLYAGEVVRYTQELQAMEAGRINDALKQQLAEMNIDMQDLEEKWRALPNSARARITTLQEKLQAANDELNNLLYRYTEKWPAVQEQRAIIAVLEKQLAEALRQPNTDVPAPANPRAPLIYMGPSRSSGPTNTSKGAVAGIRGAGLQNDVGLSELQALAAARLTLASRQREAQFFAEKPLGYCQVLAPATVSDLAVQSPRTKIAFLGVLGFVLGLGGSLVLVLLVELFDDRLKTGEDVKRVTRLPLLASLGDLTRMPHSAQSQWVFRTWTSLQNRLSISPNHGLVCGLTSSEAGEGRSTWIGLLAQAASECGFRVLTIATDARPPSDTVIEAEDETENLHEREQKEGGKSSLALAGGGSTALTTSVLATPAMVTEKLTRNDPQPYVHIPLPGWVWNLERRKQWQTALQEWSQIENIVILVELPPASCPEAVLLAENLPNLLWLADSNKARAAASREQLQTLREARCYLVGAVLNHDPASRLKRRLARWFPGWMFFAGLSFFLGLASSTQAQSVYEEEPPEATPMPAAVPVTNTPPAALTAINTLPAAVAETRTNQPFRSFSVINPSQRAPWQQRLTLGPGDSLNLALFGQPELARTDVLIGPDGRISYLQAVDVPAAGLTIDELRGKLDEELGKYYRSARTIVTPSAFRSKKYYVLGKVTNRGVYTLDQPITLLEAVARAKGLETGLVDNQNSVDLADLQRSFLMRQGKRVPVDFEKLFQEGDLSQNVPIEPGDYLYFASANLKEVYVLGEVNAPGAVLHTVATTVVGAISARGGFTDKAYKGKVLVIRGSLNRPQTFVINVWGALEAKSLNFKLENKDIIYVAHRPFVRVEEVLDLAATAFIQSAISAWAVDKVGPIITSPILP